MLVLAEDVLVLIESTDRGDKRRQIGEGHSAVIFVDLTLDPGRARRESCVTRLCLTLRETLHLVER